MNTNVVNIFIYDEFFCITRCIYVVLLKYIISVFRLEVAYMLMIMF